MAEHRIAILNRIAVADAGIELVCNNPTDTIRFEFDAEWSRIVAKTARFSWDGKYIDVPFSGNVVEVPEIYQTNHVYVGVYADNIATTPAKVKCRYSIKCLGGKVAPPSQDIYAEIIALINGSIGQNTNDISDLKTDFAAFEKNRPFNLTGNPVQVETFEGMPLNPVTVFEPAQEGAGDPSPQNIRPVTGWDALRLTNTSKNLVNPPVPISYSLQKFEYEQKTGTIAITKEEGGGVKSQLRFDLDVDASTLVGKNVTLSYKDYSITTTGDSQRIYLSNQDGATLATIWPAEESRKSVTAVIPEGTTGLIILIRIDQNGTLPVGTKLTVSGLQVEISDAATDFTPYSGVENYAKQLDQIVYGGHLNWYTGKLLSKWDMIAEYAGEPLPGVWVSDRDVYVPGTSPTLGAQVVYEMASPIEIQLEPHEINALQGVNVLYGDGEITISGRSDMQAVVSNLLKRIATLEKR